MFGLWWFQRVEEALEGQPADVRARVVDAVEAICVDAYAPVGVHVFRARGRAAHPKPDWTRMVAVLEDGWRLTYDISPPAPPSRQQMVRIMSLLHLLDGER